jgi:3(or 17)beta-hydroxysteroid dehydrogenase
VCKQRFASSPVGRWGCGKAVSGVLAAERVQVIVTDIDVEQGNAVAEQIGAAAIFIRHDVRDEVGWIERPD